MWYRKVQCGKLCAVWLARYSVAQLDTVLQRGAYNTVDCGTCGMVQWIVVRCGIVQETRV